MMRNVWLYLAAGCALACAQSPAEPKPARLEGQVINKLSGEPVRKADLTLERTGGGGRGGAYRAVSTAGGTFLFDGVEPGTYRLAARRQGFVNTEFGAKRSRQGTPVTVTAGQVLRGLSLEMTPQAVIAGRVVDEDGDPVPRTTVRVMRVKAGKITGWVGAASSDDIGEFRLGELEAGVYKLVADHRMGGARSRRADNQPDEALIRTYYPSALEPEAAAAITVTAGEVVAGAEIRIRRSLVYHVRGKIVRNDSAEPANRLGLRLSPEGLDMRMFGPPAGAVRADGGFELSGVPPGRQILTVFGQRGVTLARQTVTVGARDLDNVVILVPAPVVLTGTVSYEKAGAQPETNPGRGLWIEFAGAEDSHPPVALRPDGGFTASLAGTDRYRVRLRGTAGTLYLKSARLGQQDVLESGIDPNNTAGATELHLVIGNTNATVSGSVSDAHQQPAGGVTVVLLHMTRAGVDAYDVRTATTDQNGAFTITAAVPGVQIAAALEDWDESMARDEEVLKKLAEKGKRLELKEDSQETLQLKLVELEP